MKEMADRPRIALVHATTIAMEPISAAFQRIWPEAGLVNILDDSLPEDRGEASCIPPALLERFSALGNYAQRIGASGLLFTCSAFGTAIDRVAAELKIPVMKPNEAMFRMAIAQSSRIGMLATFKPAVATMEAEFAEEVARTGASATLETVFVEGAAEMLRRGEADNHNHLVAEKARDLSEFDVIVLAHFSTARALDAVRRVTHLPVLTAPDSAVQDMKARIVRRPG